MTEPIDEPDQDVIQSGKIPVDSLNTPDEVAQLRKMNVQLESRNYELRETVRQLRLQVAAGESSQKQLRREIRRHKIELEQFKTPPLVIGTIEALLEDDTAIVRSTTGPLFLSHICDEVGKSELVPGAQCALHPQSFVLVEVLQKKYDSQVSAMEVETAPEVSYEDIGGLATQKRLVRESIELPMKRPDLFAKVGIEPPKGVLLYGPPGTGKTLLAKAVAHETNAVFIRVVGSELVQKYIGEGARLVRELFSLARSKAPAIIFIDEIDAIGSARSTEAYSAGDHEVNRTLMQILSELDGFDSRGNIKIIAATNRIDILDQALLRPGRFDRIVEFPLPDDEERRMILSIHTKKMHLTADVSLEKLAGESEGMNGAELMAVCIEAGMEAIRGGRTKVRGTDFVTALAAVRKGRANQAGGDLPAGMYV